LDTQITFRDLGLSENLLESIERKGYIHPTAIQASTIPLLLKNEKDIIGQAQTGTGKTAAFGLPLLDLLNENINAPQALVLTPTRELALQVSEEIISFKGNKKLQVLAVYGGAGMDTQLRGLKKGAHIVVGTPGRVMDMINRKALVLDKLTHLVLDEADEMLNMGFVEDIETILESTPDNKRMLLFSATMPAPILKIATKYMGSYEQISIKKQELTNESINQLYYEVMESDKLEALVRVMEIEKDFYGLIFCQTKVDTDSVANKLIERGYQAEALHGDVSQYHRERILNKFKKKNINILVATDVAARGIDINDLTHVINYSLPQDPESYVHRIGRTGRAGKTGTAISFVAPREVRKLSFIKRITKKDIHKGKLPGVAEIIQSKIGHIKEDLHKIIEVGEYHKFEAMANDLLGAYPPSDLVAALLQYSFTESLDEKNFNKIKDYSSGSGRFDREEGRGRGRKKNSRHDGNDSRSEKRLFIALGRLDNMTPKKLVDFLKAETGVPDRFINNVKVTDKFSFVSVSDRDADRIIQRFKKQMRGNRNFVELADK
jgi:ATP-dependent RNA helicase DeaD